MRNRGDPFGRPARPPTAEPRRAGGRAALVERALLVARAGAGLAMSSVPGPVAWLWLATRSRAGRRFVRAVGVRDLVIVAGQLATRPAGVRWRLLGCLSDVFDAAVAIGRAVRCRRPATAAVAIPALGSALIVALTIRAGSGPTDSGRSTGMTAKPGERAEQTGDFHCVGCDAKVHVTKGDTIPPCPCGENEYDRRTGEPGSAG